MGLNESIGERIRCSRIMSGLSQQELALKAGYTNRSSVAKIESGNVDIPQSKIKVISEILGVTPSYITGWDDPIFIPDGEEERAKRIMSYANKLADLNVKITNETICLIKAVDGLTEEQINLLIQMANSLKHR